MFTVFSMEGAARSLPDDIEAQVDVRSLHRLEREELSKAQVQVQLAIPIIASYTRSEGDMQLNPDPVVMPLPRKEIQRQQILPLSNVRKPSQDLLVLRPMEDRYHSQLTETSLPNACGPASLVMILDYLDIEDSLANVISNQNIPPNQGGYDPYCSTNPVCTSPGALIRMAAETYELKVVAHEGWTFEQVYASLANGHPIIADIIWKLADDGLGHFVVIYGIDTSERKIYYHDPYDGAQMEANWETFSASWDGPVDRGDPLQPQGHQYWGMAVIGQ